MRHDGLAVRVETQWPLIVIGLFAIALPVQMTVMVSGTPLRLALSDGLILLSSPLALLLAWSMRAAVAKAPFPPWLAMLALATMLMIIMTRAEFP